MKLEILENFHPDFDRAVRSLTPVLLVRTIEIKRLIGYLKFYCETLEMDLAVFNPVRGFIFIIRKSANHVSKEYHWTDIREPLQAIEAIINYPNLGGPIIFLIPDLDLFFNAPSPDPYLTSVLRSLFGRPPVRSTTVLGGLWRSIPDEIGDFPVLDLPLPGPLEIESYLQSLESGGEQDREELPARELAGLPLTAIEQALSETVLLEKEEKTEFLRGKKLRYLEGRFRGALECLEPGMTLADIGGYQALKDHVEKRKKFFHPETSGKEGAVPLKGILLTGFPGTGKSTLSKAIAGTLGLPLVRFNVSLLYSSFVGASEAKMQEILKTLEAFAGEGMVLWLDEYEKMFASDRDGRTDGGVGSRVSAIFLHWISEKKPNGLYLVATANALNIEPALWRRGRFEQIFWLDPPGREERAEIFNIILKRRGMNPAGIDLNLLAGKTDLYVGAEIENLVDLVLVESESRGIKPGTLLFLECLKQQAPQIRLFKNSFQEARDSILRFAALANGPSAKSLPPASVLPLKPRKEGTA